MDFKKSDVLLLLLLIVIPSQASVETCCKDKGVPINCIGLCYEPEIPRVALPIGTPGTKLPSACTKHMPTIDKCWENDAGSIAVLESGTMGLKGQYSCNAAKKVCWERLRNCSHKSFKCVNGRTTCCNCGPC